MTEPARIEHLTRDEATRRRQDALNVLGVTLDDWRATGAGLDCRCCIDEERRATWAYPAPDYSTVMARLAAIDEINTMNYLLQEEDLT